MNSLAAHGNAGSHYVIGQYKRGRSEFISISGFVSCQFGGDSAGYPLRQFPFPQGTRDELLGGVTFPLRSRHLKAILH